MSAQLKQQTQQPAPDQELRFCPDCDAMIPITEFGINRAREDGLNRYCKTHVRERIYEFRRRHKRYQARQFQRQQARDKARKQQQATARRDPPPTADAQILAELRKGERTIDQLHRETDFSKAHIDTALVRLLTTTRLIGTRALNDDERIYFLL